MILYFSGTGNSAYAAGTIAKETGDHTEDLFQRIRTGDHAPLESEGPWVLAAPVYCWQLPHLVRDWMLATPFYGSKDIYFILTCGSSMGNAPRYLRELCAQKGLNFKGCGEVVMPENYIALFNAPGKEEAKRIISAAERALHKIAANIKEGSPLPDVKAGAAEKLLSGIVNKIYYPLVVKDKKFYAEETCTGCGLCERRCPLHNIAMENGKPVWKGNCTHCMACIAYCPQEAIEYGKATKGKERYVCPR